MNSKETPVKLFSEKNSPSTFVQDCSNSLFILTFRNNSEPDPELFPIKQEALWATYLTRRLGASGQ